MKLPNIKDVPEYAAAAAKLTELKTEQAKATARLNAVQGQLNAAGQPRKVDAIQNAAYKLLGRDTSSPGTNAAGLREELAALTETKQVLDAAETIQRETLATVRDTASKACIAQILPTHKAMVQAIVKCLRDLDAALTTEHDLIDGLYQNDILLGELRPMPLRGLGRLTDENSRASAYLIEAFEHGFVGLGALPENLHSWARAKTAKPTPAIVTRRAKADGWHA
jgi:hypothetical protein